MVSAAAGSAPSGLCDGCPSRRSSFAPFLSFASLPLQGQRLLDSAVPVLRVCVPVLRVCVVAAAVLALAGLCDACPSRSRLLDTAMPVIGVASLLGSAMPVLRVVLRVLKTQVVCRLVPGAASSIVLRSSRNSRTALPKAPTSSREVPVWAVRPKRGLHNIAWLPVHHEPNNASVLRSGWTAGELTGRRKCQPLEQPFPVSPDQCMVGHQSKITLVSHYRHARRRVGSDD